MGTGASIQLSEEQEVEIYRELQNEYEQSQRRGSQDEKEIYERLRHRFEELTTERSTIHAEAKGSSDDTAVKRAGKCASERRKSSRHSAMRIGDVVKCKLDENEALTYEGIIMEDYYDGTFMVDFGLDQSNEIVHISNMQKVLSWDQMELKDHVQVKDREMNIYSSAVVVGLHSNNTYDVVYEGSEESETYVEACRIRKVRSNRSKAMLRWRLLANTYKAFHRWSLRKTFGENLTQTQTTPRVSGAGGEGEGENGLSSSAPSATRKSAASLSSSLSTKERKK